MSDAGAFGSGGSPVSTYLVTTAALQIVGPGLSGIAMSYRVRCLVAGYLTSGSTSAVTAAGAPAAGSPVANTYGMSVGQTEVLKFSGQWFISNVANAFEVTPGEGV